KPHRKGDRQRLRCSGARNPRAVRLSDGAWISHQKREPLLSDPDSATFLDSRSPAFLGGAFKFMLNPRQVEPFQHLTEIVLNGGPLDNCFTLAPEDPMWVNFARGMAPLMVPAAQTI